MDNVPSDVKTYVIFPFLELRDVFGGISLVNKDFRECANKSMKIMKLRASMFTWEQIQGAPEKLLLRFFSEGIFDIDDKDMRNMVFVYAVFKSFTNLKDLLFDKHYRDAEKVEDERPCRGGSSHIHDILDESDAIELYKQGELCRKHCCQFSYRVDSDDRAFSQCKHWYVMKILFKCYDGESTMIQCALNHCVKKARNDYILRFFQEGLFVEKEAMRRFIGLLRGLDLKDENLGGLSVVKKLLSIRPFNDPTNYKKLLEMLLILGGSSCIEIIRYFLDVKKVGSTMTPSEKEELLKGMLQLEAKHDYFRLPSKSRALVPMMIKEDGFEPTIEVLIKEISEITNADYSFRRVEVEELDTFKLLLYHSEKMNEAVKKHSSRIISKFHAVVFRDATENTVKVLEMLLSHPHFDPVSTSSSSSPSSEEEEQLMIRNLSIADPRNQYGKDRILQMLNLLLNDPRIDPSVKNQEVLTNICKLKPSNPQCLRRLLKHPKVDVSAKDYECLRLAVDSECYGNVICLVKEGGVPFHSCDNYLLKNIGKLREYGFQNNNNNNNEEEEENMDPLQQFVKYMKDLGADFSVGNQEPLFSAISNSNFRILEILLDLGPRVVDPSVRNNKLLIDICSGVSVLPPVRVVRKLLCDERVNPASKNSSALRGAVNTGYLDIVEFLLEDGRSDPSGCLVIACRNKNVDIIRTLVGKKLVDPEELRKNDFEAYEISQQRGYDYGMGYYTGGWVTYNQSKEEQIKEIFLEAFPEVIKEYSERKLRDPKNDLEKEEDYFGT